jgi:hypothetical protein
MRAAIDDWNRNCTLVELVMALEDRLGVRFRDSELEVTTLRELTSQLLHHLPASPDCEAVAKLHLLSTMEQRGYRSVAPFDFDADLLDALKPGRWNNFNATHHGN